MMDKEQNKLYRDSHWEKCRERILKRDNYTCCRCGKKQYESELHVHHLNYYPGKKPWEYLDVDLMTLCKGCHAEEHGIIPPQSGWEYCGEDDLEDLIGICDVCGNPIRYEHHIYHPNWGYMVAGCVCADRLTGNCLASETEKKRKDEASKFRTFKESPKWKQDKNGYFRDYKGYRIKIWKNPTSYSIDVEFYCNNDFEFNVRKTIKGHKKFATLEDAEFAIFDYIFSGGLKAYILKTYGCNMQE